MARRTTGSLDERSLAAQKSFLVGIENADERNFGKIETLAEQIDTDEDVEVGRAQSAQNLDAFNRVVDLVFQWLECDFWIEESRRPDDLFNYERRAGRVHVKLFRWLIGSGNWRGALRRVR